MLLAVAEKAMALGDVRAEIGDVAAGLHPGRRGDADIQLFDSVGIGMQDLAIGRLMYDDAMRQGLGLSVDMAS